MSTIRNQLIIYDFDWSLADQDSDRWVLEVLAPHLRRRMKNLKSDHQWTDLVAQMMRELRSEGGTRVQVEQALREMPFHPAMKRCVRAIKVRSDPSTDLLVLSNANSVYIRTILEHQGLHEGVFEDVITNPAHWDEQDPDLLVVRRRVDPKGEQHKCTVGCSANMCKGEELEAFVERHGKAFDRVVYVGDGSNDFCPILRLREQDLALVRRHRGLEKRIEKEGKSAGLKCQFIYWTGAWEVEEIFATLT
ncbi:hypothetical protein DACRYDRAFT_105116 [Dacryopinax primogenitus]|uniref:Phosphatase phospho-type n=1 Tax=Dacryopinax primogenitus (strain DJM 731) TaxID=1858805 RepID=M5G1E5_DACPD|nr:uncharacterized protein DACRYDRAFT_105116 [Dacryopinax primogenitus]EJU04051.1 hypothetical protein DACRYDRAFT_105116 [Dacryopinax primogenitus]